MPPGPVRSRLRKEGIMTEEFVIGFTRQAIELTLSVALPMLGVGLAVGIVVSVIQAATQIQEMTLLAFAWIMDKLNTFTINLFLNILQYIQ